MTFVEICVWILAMTASLAAPGHSTECVVEKELECVEPIKQLTPSQRIDPDVYCPPDLVAIDCLMGVYDSCPAHVKDELTPIIEGLEDTRTLCEYHLDESKPAIQGCSVATIFRCNADVMGVPVQDQADPTKLCPVLIPATECIINELRTCPSDINPQEIADKFEKRQQECLCFTAFQECEVDGIAQQLRTQSELASSCRKAYLAADCVGDKLQTCQPGAAKTYFEEQLKAEEAEGRRICGAHWNSAPTGPRSSFWIVPFVAAILGLTRHFL